MDLEVHLKTEGKNTQAIALSSGATLQPVIVPQSSQPRRSNTKRPESQPRKDNRGQQLSKSVLPRGGWGPLWSEEFTACSWQGVSISLPYRKPWGNGLKEMKAYLVSQFHKFSAVVTWSHCFSACDKAENGVSGSEPWSRPAHLLVSRKQRELNHVSVPPPKPFTLGIHSELICSWLELSFSNCVLKPATLETNSHHKVWETITQDRYNNCL